MGIGALFIALVIGENAEPRCKDGAGTGACQRFPRRIEAVVGRPDEKWGEAPVAVIVPALRTELSRADVQALFDGKLAGFKHPHNVIFTETLPRNVMGKVLKFELRAMVSP